MLKAQNLLNELGSPKDNPKHPFEKLMILVNYVADNMENNALDEANINEVIFAAHKNITETIISMKEKDNRSLDSNELYFGTEEFGDYQTGNSVISMFISAPETVTKSMMEIQLSESVGQNGDNVSENVAAAEKERQKKLMAAINLLSGKEKNYSTYTSALSEVTNDKLNLESKLEGENRIERAIKSCKPSFGEWLLRKTSAEYKNFKTALEGRLNGTTSRQQLDKSAKDYLQHKIPGYNGQGLPKLEDIESLKGKSKSRAMLCYKTLLATNESAVYEQKLGKVIDAAENNVREHGVSDALYRLRVENSVAPNQLNNGQIANFEQVNEHQAQFRKDLAKEVKKDNVKGKSIQDNDISVKNPVAENDIVK